MPHGAKNCPLLHEILKDFDHHDKNKFKIIGDEYISKMKDFSNDYQRITDKLPLNFFWLGLIKLILPNAKIVHCYRNPEDNIFSIFKNNFTSNKVTYAYNLIEIIDYYNLYFDLMVLEQSYQVDQVALLEDLFHQLILLPHPHKLQVLGSPNIFVY